MIANRIRAAFVAAIFSVSALASAAPPGPSSVRPPVVRPAAQGGSHTSSPVRNPRHPVRGTTAVDRARSAPPRFSLASISPLLRGTKAILFDFDGTIADTHAQLRYIASKTTEEFGFAPTARDIEVYMTMHPREVFTALRPEGSTAEAERFHAAWERHANASTSLVTLYPGVRETLTKIREAHPGIRFAIATARPTALTKRILEEMGATSYFDVVEGTGLTNIPHKPAPDLLLLVARQLNVEPREAIMVGDMATDLQAGRRAGMATAAAVHGYGRAEALALENPGLTFHGFADGRATPTSATRSR